MKRRKFMKGLAAILGMTVIPTIVFSSQDSDSWTLIIEKIRELPEELWIEIGGQKCGKGWAVNMERTFKNRNIKIKIKSSPDRDDSTTIKISYKYEGNKDWRRIFIAVQNFHEKNNYIFGVELLKKNSFFNEVYWLPNSMSFTYKRMDFSNPKNFGMK